MKKLRMFALLLGLAMMVSGCSRAETQASAQEIVLAEISGMDFAYTERELSGAYDEEGAACIRGENNSIAIDGRGARLSGGGVRIEDEGTYILTGTFEDCMITVSVPDDEKVQLVLSGVELHNSKGPAIYVRSADKLFLTLAAGSRNSISDGLDYAIDDDGSSLDGAIFSRSDLCINGSGTLELSGNYKHGVVSKDDLVLAGCSLEICARKQGVSGKDSVRISGGDICIQSGADGIQSDNDEDAQRGFVYLEGTQLKIDAGSDGIQAETLLRSVDSALVIRSGGGSGQRLSAEDGSAKGLKSGGDIRLEGGSAVLDSRDDCIHANGNVAIFDGDFSLSSGDDGLHADGGVVYRGGRMEILQSYEGMEGSRMEISGGEIRITATDDGLNLAGGKDGSGSLERPGRGMFDQLDGSIEISGGFMHIRAGGDGVDSNGSVSLLGGVTLVSGPVGNGNAAFDHNGASVSGGVFIAVGSAGMAQGFTAAENQGAILTRFDGQAAGTSIALCDTAGNVLAAFTPEADYQSAVITSPTLQPGESYRLIAGAQIAAAGDFGFAKSGRAEGGAVLAEIEMTELLYGGGESGMHGFGGRGFGQRGFDQEAFDEGGFGGKRMRGRSEERPETMPEPPDGFGGEMWETMPEFAGGF